MEQKPNQLEALDIGLFSNITSESKTVKENQERDRIFKILSILPVDMIFQIIFESISETETSQSMSFFTQLWPEFFPRNKLIPIQYHIISNWLITGIISGILTTNFDETLERAIEKKRDQFLEE